MPSPTKFVSRVLPALASLPKKLTAEQALRHLEKRASPTEIRQTLPRLYGAAEDNPFMPLTKEHIQDSFVPLELNQTIRTGEGLAFEDEPIYRENHRPRYDEENQQVVINMADLNAFDQYDEVVSTSTIEQRVGTHSPALRLDLAHAYFGSTPHHLREEVMPVIDEMKIKVKPEHIEYFAGLNIKPPPEHMDRLSHYVVEGPNRDRTPAGSWNQANQMARDTMRRDEPHAMFQPTEFGEYTLPGEKTNYTENTTQLTSPNTLAPMDTLSYMEPHFPGDDILWHNRMSMRKSHPDNTPTALLEELQSEWAREGRESGWLPNPYLPEHLKPSPSTPPAPRYLSSNPGGQKSFAFYDTKSHDPAYPKDDMAAYHHYSMPGQTQGDARRKMVDHLNQHGPRLRDAVPPMPYAKKWELPAFQQALVQAHEMDSPGLAWTMGREQLRRYPGMNPSEQRGLMFYYDQKLRNMASKVGKPHDTYPTTLRLQTEPKEFVIPKKDYDSNPRGHAFDYHDDGVHWADPMKTEYGRQTIGRSHPLRQIVRNTERTHYLPFSDSLKRQIDQWIKKGLPLSLLPASLLPPDEQ